MMANPSPVDELIRRAVDLNVRYYSAMGTLTANYLKDVLGTLSSVNPLRVQRTEPQPNPASAKAQQSAVMVLEAEAAGVALGVFLIENHLKHSVSTRVVPSTFTDPAGHVLQPAFAFEPEAVVLQPGEQVLVRVRVPIDETLSPDVRYVGSFNIPELGGANIPIVLRRRSGNGVAS
jgi:hypothetical protein